MMSMVQPVNLFDCQMLQLGYLCNLSTGFFLSRTRLSGKFLSRAAFVSCYSHPANPGRSFNCLTLKRINQTLHTYTFSLPFVFFL